MPYVICWFLNQGKGSQELTIRRTGQAQRLKHGIINKHHHVDHKQLFHKVSRGRNKISSMKSLDRPDCLSQGALNKKGIIVVTSQIGTLGEVINANLKEVRDMRLQTKRKRSQKRKLHIQLRRLKHQNSSQNQVKRNNHRVKLRKLTLNNQNLAKRINMRNQETGIAKQENQGILEMRDLVTGIEEEGVEEELLMVKMRGVFLRT